MADITTVQLPDGSTHNVKDNTSGYATIAYVDSEIGSLTKSSIGLGNVDNTSDLNKPVSTAQQTALDAKANNSLVAYVESSTTATRRYEIGDHFILNGVRYKATAIIANGGTITVGTNCAVSDTVSEELENLSEAANKTDIATVESGTTASRAYSVGELVYVSGTLYRVKTAIASGTTFTVGANIEATNVSNFLNQFSSVDIRSLGSQDITRLRGSITQIGNVCILIGTWAGSATNTTNILTLPTQYRPSSTISSGGAGGITINGVYIKAEYTINADGTVRQAESVATGTSGDFIFVYTL